MEEGDACARAQLLGYDELSQLKCKLETTLGL